MNMRKMLVVVLGTMLFYGEGFALTNGPSQPEFSSFEPVDATDLVNLPTGDFTYVLPLGKVRTPDGTGYPVVLDYHGGIMNDQEATWVGLGWSLNVGSINRQVRNLPDDYDDYSVLSQMYLTGERGWSLDIGVGWGPVSASVGFSGKAGGGVTFEGLTSFSVGYGAEGSPITTGITLSRSGMSVGMNYNFGSASMGAGVTVGGSGGVSGYASAGLHTEEGTSVAGFSLASGGHTNVSIAGQSMPQSQSMSKGGMHQWSSSFSIFLPLPSTFSVSLGFQEWGWTYNLKRDDKSRGYLFKSINTAKEVITDNDLINYCMSNNVNGYVYGTSHSSAVTAINDDGKSEKVEYSALGRFNVPSNDVYTISGQGVSGTFMPISSTWSEGVHSELQDPDYDGIIGIPKSKTVPLTYDVTFADDIGKNRS